VLIAIGIAFFGGYMKDSRADDLKDRGVRTPTAASPPPPAASL
jgi:hypothetical protein